MTLSDAIVIGSGHAGVACAKALVDAGVRTTVVDASVPREGNRQATFDTLSQSEPEQWSRDLLETARSYFPASIRGVPLKPAYGSYFPYALDDVDFRVEQVRSSARSSLARGGLSNTWGAAMLPYRQEDIQDWPIRVSDLEPHYRAVLSFVPLVGEHDDLTKLLPMYADPVSRLRRTPQVERVAEHWQAHQRQLVERGFLFGSSRLAVVADQARDDHCRYCGLCMHGCPYGSIYNSWHSLRELVDRKRVTHRVGLFVDRLREEDGRVVLEYHERDRSGHGVLRADRVFVACGTISTTRLIAESMAEPPASVHLVDSQTFTMPLLTPRSSVVSTENQGNTLAQLFLEVEDETVASRTVHLQLYGYSDIMLKAILHRLPAERATAERLLRPLIGRLVVMHGFVHSDDSPGFTIERLADGIRTVGDESEDSRAVVTRLLAKMRRSAIDLGMIPVPMLTQVGLPGKSFHTGGSFPMRRRPGRLESDLLGRPTGFDRVHVVDSSVFPSVPATTIALTAMANAHRIGSAAAALG